MAKKSRPLFITTKVDKIFQQSLCVPKMLVVQKAVTATRSERVNASSTVPRNAWKDGSREGMQKG